VPEKNMNIPSLTLLVAAAFLLPPAALGQEPEPDTPPVSEEEIVEEVVEEETETEAPFPTFDQTKAVMGSTEILYSSEAARLVKQCLIKWSYKIPPSLSIIVVVSPDGSVQDVEVKEAVDPNARTCIEDELAAIPFLPAPGPYSAAARYSFKPAETEGAGEPKPPQPGGIAPAAETFEGGDPDSSRVVYLQSAFPRGRGRFNFMTLWGGHVKLAYGLTDHVDLTFSTCLPILIWGFGVFPKFSFRLHEKVRLAMKLDFGLGYPYFIFGPRSVGLMYGGAPLILTAGTEDFYFNFSVHLHGMSFFEHNDWISESSGETEISNLFVITPSVGASIRLARMLKFNLEVLGFFVPLYDRGRNETLSGKIWAVMYGFRIFKGRFYGDVSFLIPVFPGWWDVQKYVPIGFPMASFGFTMDVKKKN
jgi:hypothetical protein